MDYPSPNFIRPQQFSSKCHEVQVDEASKLTVRLHYNPVMDEWLSLTEEVAPKQQEDSGEILISKNPPSHSGTIYDFDDSIDTLKF